MVSSLKVEFLAKVCSEGFPYLEFTHLSLENFARGILFQLPYPHFIDWIVFFSFNLSFILYVLQLCCGSGSAIRFRWFVGILASARDAGYSVVAFWWKGTPCRQLGWNFPYIEAFLGLGQIIRLRGSVVFCIHCCNFTGWMWSMYFPVVRDWIDPYSIWRKGRSLARREALFVEDQLSTFFSDFWCSPRHFSGVSVTLCLFNPIAYRLPLFWRSLVEGSIFPSTALFVVWPARRNPLLDSPYLKRSDEGAFFSHLCTSSPNSVDWDMKYHQGKTFFHLPTSTLDTLNANFCSLGGTLWAICGLMRVNFSAVFVVLLQPDRRLDRCGSHRFVARLYSALSTNIHAQLFVSRIPSLLSPPARVLFVKWPYTVFNTAVRMFCNWLYFFGKGRLWQTLLRSTLAQEKIPVFWAKNIFFLSWLQLLVSHFMDERRWVALDFILAT